MDATTFGTDLQEALDDLAGVAYVDSARASATRRALAEHAIYRPRRVSVTVALVAGTGQYSLPSGFLQPESESLARALGGPGSVRRRGGFHDGAWIVASRYSGTGASYRAGFGSSIPYGFFGNLGLGGGGFAPETILDFREEDPPVLLVTPPPNGDGTLTFDGLFPHSIDSYPETDREPLLCLARACCLEAKARSLGALGRYKERDVERDRSRAAESLANQARAAREEYKDLVRMRPIMVGG